MEKVSHGLEIDPSSGEPLCTLASIQQVAAKPRRWIVEVKIVSCIFTIRNIDGLGLRMREDYSQHPKSLRIRDAVR